MCLSTFPSFLKVDGPEKEGIINKGKGRRKSSFLSGNALLAAKAREGVSLLIAYLLVNLVQMGH
jgi:hypothetical protein